MVALLESGGEMTRLCRRRSGTSSAGQELIRRLAALARLELILQTAILAVAFAGAAGAEDLGSRENVQAKLSYCKDCHGPSAQGYRGYFPIPRLAGQQTQYLENQLQAFIEHRRTNNIMFNVAHALSPSMISALAANFRDLNPAPVGGAPRQPVAEGKRIFEDGAPEVNVAACAACHGPNAQGVGDIPRLAGQLYPYLIKELINWGKERGQNPAKPDTSAIMSPVAHSLSKAQIEAISAYLSYLK
jgi:cytochrome c553